MSYEVKLETALEVQKENLEFWKGKLKPQVFKELETQVLKSNEGITEGNKIVRGSSLDIIIKRMK